MQDRLVDMPWNFKHFDSIPLTKSALARNHLGRTVFK